MPKETFTMSDFSGGMNQGSNFFDTSLIPKKQVINANRMHFDNEGTISRADDYPTFDDAGTVTNGNITTGLVKLDTGLGNTDPTQAHALTIAVADVDSVTPSDELSWEDGIYDFKYTACKDLGNGIIEEGPLQDFYNNAGLGVNMTGDSKGKFTFSNTDYGSDGPTWMNDADYEGKIAGRVYYSKRAGQGSSTQTGYIHLCDLILVTWDGSNGIMPRAIGNTGTTGLALEIEIEEPPTSSTFEMNAGYPSDVGIKDVTSSPFTGVSAKVQIGMTTYIAHGGYIYRSVPGQPDIYPTDNWIDMTKYGTSAPTGLYGPCSAMYGVGDILMYYTQEALALFNVTNDTIVKEIQGQGLEMWRLSCQVENGVVWLGGNMTDGASDAGEVDFSPPVYYFDGSQIKDLNQNRILFQALAFTQIQYNQERRWLKIPFSGSESGFFIFSFKTNTWFFDTTVSNGYDGFPWINFPSFTAGDPGRFKKIYKIIVHGGGTSASLSARDEDRSNIPITQSAGGDAYQTEWTPDSTCKIKELFLRFRDIGKLYPFRGLTIVYRMTNKF